MVRLLFVLVVFLLYGMTSIANTGITLIQPKNNSVVSNVSVYFQWNVLPEALNYKLQIATENTFQTIVDSAITSNNDTNLSLTFGQTYYWRVLVDTGGSGFLNLSNQHQFTLFTPSNLGNLQLWLNPDTGITKSANDSVSSWADVYSSNVAFTQSNNVQKPVWVDSVLNNRPVVNFDGSNDFLSAGDTLDQKFNSRTIFVLGEATASSSCYLAKSDSANLDRFAIYYFSPKLYFDYINNGTMNHVSITNSFGDYEIITAHTDRINQLNKLYENSNLLGSAVGILNNSYNFNSKFRFLIGAFNNSDDTGEIFYLNGNIAEIIIYDSALTDSARNLVEQYLRQKYYPPVCLGEDILVVYSFCDISIQADTAFSSYLWSTGDMAASISASVPGTYWVTVQDIFGYQSSDTVKVKHPLKLLKDTTICLGDTIFWDTGLDTLGYDFAWSTGATDSFIVITQAGNYAVTVTDTIGGAGCSYQSDTITVSVDSFPVLPWLGPDTSFCAGNPIGLVQGDSLVASYLWFPGIDTTSTKNVDTSGSYSLIVDNYIGCFAYDTIIVTIVGIAPLAGFVADTVCTGDSTAFTDTSVTVDSLVSWQWNFGDGNTDTVQYPNHQYDTAGVYNVTLTVATDSGCGAASTEQVLVRENSIASFTFNPNPVGCANNSVSFYDSSTVAVGDTLISWNWDFGDGTGSSNNTNPSYTYMVDSIYPVLLTINTVKGCSADTSVNITILASSVAPGAYTLICPLNDQMIIDSITIFEWNSSENGVYYQLEIATDNGFANVIFQSSLIQSLSYSASMVATGFYYWRVTAFNICNDSSFSNIRKIHVFAPTDIGSLNLWLDVGVGVTKGSNDSVSEWVDVFSSNISFAQTDIAKQPVWIDSVLNNKPILNFDGNNDFLSAGDTLDLDFNSRSIFVLGKSNVTNSCYLGKSDTSNSDRFGIYYAGTQLYFDYINNGTANHTSLVNSYGDYEIITALTDRVNQLNKLYENSNLLGSTSGIMDNSYFFNSAFRFLIGAFNSSDDSGEIFNLNGEIGDIIIYNAVLNDSTRNLVEQYLRHKYSPPVCLGADLVLDGFCGATVNADSVYVSYAWSTDTVNDTLQTITITQPGTYSVTVTDIFGYTSSDTLEVFYPGNLGTFNDTTICLNDTTTWDTQLDTASFTFQWSDATTDPSLNITQAGGYYVIITDDSSCVYYSDTIIVAVDSFELVVSLGADDSLCAGNSIGLVQGNAQTVSYQWGCGSIATMPSIQVTITDTFCVTVTNSLGCEATDSVYIIVDNIAPIVNFTADTTCFGNSTQFTDASSVTSPDNLLSWDWDFGDGDTSDTTNPIHLYDSTDSYLVLLTVTTDLGCSDTSSIWFTVHPNPQAGFDPLTVCSNTPVTLNDLSTISAGSVASWMWYFDTDTLAVQNPVHTFSNSGTSNVTQIVSSVFGCADSITQIVTVNPSPIPGFTAALSCGSNSVTFNDTSFIQSPFSILSLTWDFGDASTGSLPSLAHLYSDTGTYIVSLTVQSTSGCSATITDTIGVFPIIITANFSNVDPCYNQSYQYLDSSTISGGSIISWEWSFNNIDSVYDQNPWYTFTDSGSFPVTLTVTSSTGCIDSITQSVTVHDQPIANFDFNPKFGINPLEAVNFSNLSSGATSYLWMFGDASISTLDTPTHAYLDTGVYQIVLHAFTDFNCIDSLTKTVDVRRPRLDVDLNAVKMDCLPTIIQNITLTLINRGTREITSLDLFVRIDGGDPIREQWTGFLAPGESMYYTFNVDFPYSGNSAVNYVCSWVENPNGQVDEVASNDEKCVACRNEFIIIEPFPNPSSGTVNFWFILPQDEFIEASIYDARGAYIGLVISQQASKGLNELTVNTKAFTMRKGVYVILFTYRDNNYMKSFVIQ